MKICSNNQQAEFFIALESAELIISEIFWRKYKTVTNLSRYQKITFWCWTYTSKFLTSVSSWHAGNKCSMNFISLCMYVAWYHVSEIWISNNVLSLLIFIFDDESVLDVHNEYFTRVRPTPPNVHFFVRPTPTYFDDLHNFQNNFRDNACVCYKGQCFMQSKLVLVSV